MAKTYFEEYDVRLLSKVEDMELYVDNYKQPIDKGL
jgi:hypothetical protein